MPSLYLTNTGSQSMSYTIEALAVGYYSSGTISGAGSKVVNLPLVLITGSYRDQNKGIYLQTNSTNVTVIGQNLYSYSRGGDTFLALPTEKVCCTDYVYYGISVTSGIGDSVVLIVGTENDTVMNLTVTQSVIIKVNDTFFSHRGTEYSFIVNRLQTVYIRSSRDLTGTRIVTNKPVSVFSGHECRKARLSRRRNCEHLIEQIPPTTYWGKSYYIAPLQGRSGYNIRVLAAYNSTEVITDCNQKNFYTINAGSFFSATHHSYCAIHSNKEILVVQYSPEYNYDRKTGGTMMMLVPATVLYSNEINLSTSSSSYYTNYINIIVLKKYYQPSMMYWITGGVKRSLKSQLWNAIKFNQITEAYYTQLSVSNGTVSIAHHATDALISGVVYGVGYRNSYGHFGRFSIQNDSRG